MAEVSEESSMMVVVVVMMMMSALQSGTFHSMASYSNPKNMIVNGKRILLCFVNALS